LPRAYAKQQVPADHAQMRVYVMNKSITNATGAVVEPFGAVANTNSQTLAAVTALAGEWMMQNADQQHPNVSGESWKANAPPEPPLGDMRNFVESLHTNEKYGGQLPPIYVAALRNRMLDLATSIAEGALWANASYSYTTTQVSRVETAQRDSGFYLANMIPTVISEDRKAAAAVNRKTMSTYVRLPNYRNYWKAAGYVEEMEAIESAIAEGNTNDHSNLMSDRWLEDCTLFGSPHEIREGFQRWRSLGIEPIAVMSSTAGGQVKAIGELFDVYAA
jgi:hypothetical protein